MELAATLEPHASSLLQDRRERVGVGEFLVLGVQHIDVLRACLLPAARSRRILLVDGIATRSRYVDDQSIWTSRGRDESRVDLRSHRPAANHDDGSTCGANLRPTPGDKGAWQNERCDDGRATHDEHDNPRRESSAEKLEVGPPKSERSPNRA